MGKLAWATGVLLLSAAGWGQTTQPTQAGDAAPRPEEPVTTLKVSTRVVAISAVVRNKTERITGLTKDDFVLRQDGQEKPIRYFSQGSDLPLTLALMVDTSESQRTFIGDESLASDVFLETMLGRKEDRATLIQFDSRVLELRGLTNSTSALHLALLGLDSKPSTAKGTLLDDAVYAVAKKILASQTGRKAMVILSDGGDNGSQRSLAEAIEQAQRGDVQIYSVLYSEAERSSVGAAPMLAAGDTGFHTLQMLSESTGGRVFRISRSMGLREIFAEIEQDLRLQYEIGYVPPADTPANSYHKLELRTKDKKLTVQARRGFFAPP